MKDDKIQMLMLKFKESEHYKEWHEKRMESYKYHHSWVQYEKIKSMDLEEFKKKFKEFYRNGGGVQTFNQINLNRLLSELPKLKEMVLELINIEKPLEVRFNRVVNHEMEDHIQGFGKGLASGLLMDNDIDRYCVWNNKTNSGLQVLNLDLSSKSFDDVGANYVAVLEELNKIRDKISGSKEVFNYDEIDNFLHWVAAEEEGKKAVLVIEPNFSLMTENSSLIEIHNISLYLRNNYFSIQKEFKFLSKDFQKFKVFFEHTENPANQIFSDNYQKYIEIEKLIDSGQIDEIRDLNQSVLCIPFQKLNDSNISSDKFALYLSLKKNKNILIRFGPPNEAKTSIQANIDAWKKIPDPNVKSIITQLLEQYEADSKPNIVKLDIHIEYRNSQNEIRIIKSEEDIIEADFVINKNVLLKLKKMQSLYLKNEQLPTKSKLIEYYNLFKQKFGPDVLSQLDGVELLEKLHDLQDPNSLVYWLEYKNDDEFPAIFGGISGGSALKYRIYRRKETGKWTTGSSRNQYEISEPEAIEYARDHRDQFIEGCRILKNMPSNPSKEDYKKLQLDMDEKVPDLSRLAWGRKYFSLLYPDILDDFLSQDFQKSRLIQIQLNPELGEGRYVNSWYFKKLQQIMNVPMNHITSTLNLMFKTPYNYWIYQIQNLDIKKELLTFMRENNVLSIPLPESGDLNRFNMTRMRKAKEEIHRYLVPRYSGRFNHIIVTQQLINFKRKLKARDLIIVADKTRVKGIGRINEDSVYDFNINDNPYSHQLQMNWIDFTEWDLINLNLSEDFFLELKEIDHQIEIEKYLLNLEILPSEELTQEGYEIYDEIVELDELPETLKKIKRTIERKSQIILYGPPGTGKTFWAEKAVCELTSREVFKKSFRYLNETERKQIINDSDIILESDPKGYVRICCFHPSYGYEDFIEGFKPKLNKNNELIFKLKKGIFSKICKDAKDDRGHNYYLLIDEINRGDIPRIFGETMMVLEKNKRNKPVFTASGSNLIIPDNLYIIGTMNTADRSIALMDLALRRRFGFIELMPNSNLFKDIVLDKFHLKSWFEATNSEIVKSFGVDGRNLQIGHSFFMSKSGVIDNFNSFFRILKEEIFPLLEEYCYDDISLLENFIDPKYIDQTSKSINWEKFENNDTKELIRALLQPFPDLITEKEAVKSNTEEEGKPLEEPEEDIN